MEEVWSAVGHEEVVDQRRAVCLDSFWASREGPYVLTYPLNQISSLLFNREKNKQVDETKQKGNTLKRTNFTILEISFH